MNSHILSICAALALFSAAAVNAAEVSVKPQPEASIPFANHGGIYDWRADRDQGLWIQDVHRQWYYAKLMGPCWGLDFANTIGFDTRPNGDFDRFSAIFVPREGGRRCVVQSFELSVGPSPKSKGAAATQRQ